MSWLQAVLIAEARASNRAVRSALVRHRYIGGDPMALVLWQLGAEPFTFGAIAWGHRKNDRNLAVPGEPRDRELAFRAILPVAKAFNEWFESSPEPQVVIANGGSASLLARLGRRLAYLRNDGAFPADPALIRFGRHLRFLGDRSRHPGQQLVIVLTDLLGSHWVTELSSLEAQSLAALDAAIAPPRGKTAHKAALDAEGLPIGPVPGASEDKRLEPLVDAFNKARGRRTDEAVVAPLRRPVEAHYHDLVFDHAWPLVWRCLEREAEFPQAPGASRRWSDDLSALRFHLDALGPRRVRQTHRQAARTLQTWEDAQKLLLAEEAIDDRLRMIPHVLAHAAMIGEVIEVDDDHRECINDKWLRRPRVTLELPSRCIMPVGKQLYWTQDAKANPYELLELRESEDETWIAVLQYPTGAAKKLPVVGDEATFSVHTLTPGYRPRYPDDPPWTHVRSRPEQASIEAERDAGGWE